LGCLNTLADIQGGIRVLSALSVLHVEGALAVRMQGEAEALAGISGGPASVSADVIGATLARARR
jgi:hypothetical protein